MMRAPILGVDCAARNIGLAWPIPVEATEVPQYNAETIHDEGLRGAERLVHMGRTFSRWLDMIRPELVLLEGYGFASKELATQAEVGGVIRRELGLRGIHYQVIAPPTLKKAITGKGNASKDRVEIAVNLGLRKSGAELIASDDHQADALGLAWIMIEAAAWWVTPLSDRSADVIKVVRAALPAQFLPQ